MYAVNIADWHAYENEAMLNALLLRVISMESRIARCEPEIDGDGIVLDCDEERGEAILHVIRKRFKRNQLRFYHSETGKGWEKLW